MTTTATNDRTSAVANGFTPIPFNFQAASGDEIGVIRDNVPEFGTYTVVLNGDGTGSVTPLVDWGTSAVTIFSDPSFEQSSVFPRFAPFFPDQIEATLDRMARTIISLKNRLDRSAPDATLRTDMAGTGGAGLVGTLGGYSLQQRLANPGIAGAVAATPPNPPFTNGAHYASLQWLLNGADPAAWYAAQFAGNHATEVFSAGIVVPSTATHYQTNAVAVYMRSDRAQPLNGGDVALFSDATSNADNGAVFALNTVANDTTGKTGQVLSIEMDYNVSAPDTDVNGINMVIVSTTGGALTGNRIAYAARGVFSAASQWSHGFYTDDGSVEIYGLWLGSQTAVPGTARNSQKIAFSAYKADNTRLNATINGSSTGSLQFSLGLDTGSFEFMNVARSAFFALIGPNGLSLPIVAAASIGNAPAGFLNIFVDSADNKVKTKDSAGVVVILTN